MHTERPDSSNVAQSFSATLDEMFRMDGLGALELSVEQKKDQVRQQERSLEVLDARLREAEDRLKKLEAKHKRQSQSFASAAAAAAAAPATTSSAPMHQGEGRFEKRPESSRSGLTGRAQ